MNKKPIFAGFLLVLLLIVMGTAATACQYCRMAATDPEAARMAAQIHSGGFPLDAAISQFQGTVPAAILTAPPAPDSVATSAIDLLPAAGRLRTVPPANKITPTAFAPSKQMAKATPPSVHWSDAGLVGLTAVGGLFCWRTRRVFSPVA